jgi:hypothetical protein
MPTTAKVMIRVRRRGQEGDAGGDDSGDRESGRRHVGGGAEPGQPLGADDDPVAVERVDEPGGRGLGGQGAGDKAEHDQGQGDLAAPGAERVGEHRAQPVGVLAAVMGTALQIRPPDAASADSR